MLLLSENFERVVQDSGSHVCAILCEHNHRQFWLAKKFPVYRPKILLRFLSDMAYSWPITLLRYCHNLKAVLCPINKITQAECSKNIVLMNM